MSELWLDLLPILAVMFISPARTLGVILLLHTPKQAVTASAYVLGMIGAMTGQGVLLSLLMHVVGLTVERRGGELMTVVSALFVVVGLILLSGAGKFLAHDDDDKAPPEWFSKIEVMSPSQAFKLGVGWLMVSPKQWALVLTAVAVIFTSFLAPLISLLNFFIFTLLVQTVFFIIIGIHLLMPHRSQRILDMLFAWIKRNLRVMAIVLFGFFGLFFLIKGLIGLIG